MREANIHVVTNNAQYGDSAAQEAAITTTDVLCFQDFNAGDLFFKNAGAGSNTTINLVGIKMTEGHKKELEVV